ncbi:MAG: ABC transporter permease [Phycisphaerales bacterium]|nr:ABC transporter permease [Phycisphaerales bacterium]
MRKTLVIAVREYQAAVRTKTFVVSLVIMPLMGSAGLIAAWMFKDQVHVGDKRFAIVDRTGVLFHSIAAAADDYNETVVFESAGENGGARRRQIKPRFMVEAVDPRAEGDGLRAELSDRVRHGELAGFVEIQPGALDAADAPLVGERARQDSRTSGDSRTGGDSRTSGGMSESDAFAILRHGIDFPTAEAVGRPDDAAASGDGPIVYHSNNPMYFEFRVWLEGVVNSVARERRIRSTGLDPAVVGWVSRHVPVEHAPLYQRTADGALLPAQKYDHYVQVAARVTLCFLLFTVILIGAMPLTYSVLEEKMQRTAEVLLGSVTTFQFMMGKLLGMVGVSLTIVTIYLFVGFMSASYFGYGHMLPRDLVTWFVLYQACAILMFGSIYIAIGAACNDIKDAQNLMTPASVIACIPLFVIRPVMLEPNSTFSTLVSLFPPATPVLMLLRQGLPAPVPLWQPIVGLILVVATSLVCVGIAARIFRIGILMQGQGANLREIIYWAFAREGRMPSIPRRRSGDDTPTTWARPHSEPIAS